MYIIVYIDIHMFISVILSLFETNVFFLNPNVELDLGLRTQPPQLLALSLRPHDVQSSISCMSHMGVSQNGGYPPNRWFMSWKIPSIKGS